MRQFVISDIHGCFKTFKTLLEKIEFSKRDELFLLGDYIDRGPNSKAVIDHIWELERAGYRIRCLKGNHEQMMLDSALSDEKRSFWLRNGGYETLSSFGAQRVSDIPTEYIDWMNDLPHHIALDRYILVHAGFKFDMPDPFEESHSMLWARHWYNQINYDWLGDRIIIHGHTPTSYDVLTQQVENVRDLPVIVIDNGCVFGRAGLSGLVALQLESHDVYRQDCVD